MEKLYSKILGSFVFVDDMRPITTIKDLILDPDSGSVIAFVVNINKNLIITPFDIIAFNDIIRISHPDDIISATDILRVQEAQEGGRYFHKASIYTKKGDNLGIVVDFTIDTTTLQLKNLYIAKSILGLVRYDQRIIPAMEILEILPGRIIIKEDKRTRKAQERLPATEKALA